MSGTVRDIGSRLLAVANGVRNPTERQFIYEQAMTELERRAAPPPIGSPGAGIALMRSSVAKPLGKNR